MLVLRRQDGAVVAAFSACGATKEGIVEAAKEDYAALLRERAGPLGDGGRGAPKPKRLSTERVEGSSPEALRDYTTTRDRAATTRGSNWLSASPISSPTTSVGGRGPL